MFVVLLGGAAAYALAHFILWVVSENLILGLWFLGIIISLVIIIVSIWFED